MLSTSPPGLRSSVVVSDSVFKELVLISRINNYTFNIKKSEVQSIVPHRIGGL